MWRRACTVALVGLVFFSGVNPTLAAPVVQTDGPANTWIAVLRGDLVSAADARATIAGAVLDFGLRLDVLYSSDYPNLRPGYWVIYTGPFRTEAEATTAAQYARSIGYPGAYPRWVGDRGQQGYFLPYPTSNFWTVFLHGDLTSEADARSRALDIAQRYSYGDGAIDYLYSSNYTNLRPGYWVVYVRGLSSEDEARREAGRWRDRGLAGAYARWVADQR